MKVHSICVFLIVSAAQLLFVTRGVAAPDYHAVVLYSPGSPQGFSSAYYTPDVGNGGQLFGYGLTPSGANRTRALLWSAEHPNGLDLHPAGRVSSYGGYAANGFQAGYSKLNNDVSTIRATVWSGTPESAIDLHPAGYLGSTASDAVAGMQVGKARATDSHFHAMLWRGSPQSAVDLHAGPFDDSGIISTDGLQQVGYSGNLPNGTPLHAMLWTGTAASAVDLNPPGYARSVAYDVAGGQQVGYGVKGLTDPLLWTGTPESAINLNPTHFGSATVRSTNGSVQVGWFHLEEVDNAVAWFGTAESRIDLHHFLPTQFIASKAMSIDADGTIYGLAKDATDKTYVVAWLVPEPSGLIGALAIAIFSCARRNPRRINC